MTIAAMTSHGAVSTVMSKPNSAARVDSRQAIVPRSAPSAICMLRACTISPIVIMKTVKLASSTKSAASLSNQNTCAARLEADDGDTQHPTFREPRCAMSHSFVTSAHVLALRIVRSCSTTDKETTRARRDTVAIVYGVKMSLPSFPDFPPLQDSSQDASEIRTDLAQWSDGARQESEFGLNLEVTSGGWSWRRSKAEIDTVVQFLRENGVRGFLFTPPTTQETAAFKCLRRKRREITSDSDRLDCEFEQVFVP
jgi:phage-related protein